MEIIIQSYTFLPGARTVELDDYEDILLENIIEIVNVTKNEVIYNPRSKGSGGSLITGGDDNVVLLRHPCLDMTTADSLMIRYFDAAHVVSTEEVSDE